jgi:hypothetical protein
MPSRPLLAITDWPGGFEQTKCWMDFVVPPWMRMGFDPVVCHAGEFEHREGAVFLHGRKVDIIYRMFLPAEMTDEPATWELIDPILSAVERGSVHLYAGMDCEVFGSKASLAMLSDERNRTLFTPTEGELIERVLPWTRFLRAEKSTRCGESVDLLPYVLANREHLLIKPTTLYGSRGVTAGWRVDQSEWNAQVNNAVGRQFVVQERVLPTAERFLNETGGVLHEMVVLYGIMLVGGRYAGGLARVNPDKEVGILNITNAEIGCTFHVEEQ